MAKIVRFDEKIHDESELFVCPSCGTELHVDCVGQECPVCDVEIEGERQLFSDQEKLANKQKQIAEELNLRREGRLATKDAQISLALASLDHIGAARLINERVNLSTEDLAQRFDLLRAWQDEFYKSGRDNGLNFYLLVSVEIGCIIEERFNLLEQIENDAPQNINS